MKGPIDKYRLQGCFQTSDRTVPAYEIFPPSEGAEKFFGTEIGGSDISFQVLTHLKSFSDFKWGTSFLLKSKKASIGGVKVDFEISPKSRSLVKDHARGPVCSDPQR